MTPVIFTGPPDPAHGGNLPYKAKGGDGRALIIYSLRGLEELPIHGAALIVGEHLGGLCVLHTSDDLGPWLASGWRLTSF